MRVSRLFRGLKLTVVPHWMPQAFHWIQPSCSPLLDSSGAVPQERNATSFADVSSIPPCCLCGPGNVLNAFCGRGGTSGSGLSDLFPVLTRFLASADFF